MTSAATSFKSFQVGKVEVSDGAIEVIKWLAIFLMTIDHINKYLFSGSIDVIFAMGRIAMPLFVLVMAYNLARPGAVNRGTYLRSIKRLSVFAVISCIPFVALGDGKWWPLNILFLLLLSAVIIYLSESGKKSHSWMAYGLFVVGGAFVEYWWPALGLALVSYYYFKSPSLIKLSGMAVIIGSLWVINHNFWALAALPLFFALAKINVGLPRSKWYVFYAYYPLHLTAILAVGMLS